MTFILKLRHWQVFPIILLGAILYGFTFIGHETLTTISTVAGGVILFSWTLLTGHALYQILPERIKLNYNLFLLNSFISLTAFLTIRIVYEGQDFSFDGFAALPGFYFVFACLHFLIFPVRALRSIEKGTKASVSECIGDFLLIVFLPIGIWFLQPRINKVQTTQEDHQA
jgi:peptidoglycan/LPS O-acetylase OafA/YrhL